MTEDVFLVKREDLGRQWVNGSLAALEKELMPFIEIVVNTKIGTLGDKNGH